MVVEVTSFRAVDDARFLAADARVQTAFFYQQPGIVRRTTARADDGEWSVITMWATDDDAARAEAAFAEDEFWATVDRDSVQTKRYTSLD